MVTRIIYLGVYIYMYIYKYKKACFKVESLDLGFELKVCSFCRLAESKIQTEGMMNVYREIKTKCDWVLNSVCRFRRLAESEFQTAGAMNAYRDHDKV